jgi:hypothetical protein
MQQHHLAANNAENDPANSIARSADGRRAFQSASQIRLLNVFADRNSIRQRQVQDPLGTGFRPAAVA